MLSHEDFFEILLIKKYQKHGIEKIVRVGKRNTIYLPKAIVEELGIKKRHVSLSLW